MSIEVLFAVGVVVAFVCGVRSTIRLWRRYHDAKAVLLDWRERLILKSFVTVSVVITGAAGFYGFMAVRRLMGFDSLEWASAVSALVAIGVLFIPVALDAAVQRIARP